LARIRAQLYPNRESIGVSRKDAAEAVMQGISAGNVQAAKKCGTIEL
jgi:hypothetical protein